MAAAALLATGVAMAADQAPPPQFKLADASLQLVRQGAHGLPDHRLTLNGAGESMLDVNRRPQRFKLPAPDLLAALNALHTLRFFDMPAHYGPLRNNLLSKDGTVGTAVTMMADSGSTQVCFAVADYRKCVAYERDPPPALEDFVRQQFADAARRVAVPGTGK